MIIDAHHHLWDPAARDYPWLVDLDPIRRRYDLADLRAVVGVGVDRTVLVQTLPSVSETEEFLAVATASAGLIAGVVGWVDLTDPGVGDTLDRLRSAGPLVGVRHQVEDEPDPDWLLRDDVCRGLDLVASRGLGYDLLVRAAARQAALEIARGYDEAVWILDHAGKPGIAAGEWEPWAGWIADLAGCPNVVVKLSGLVTEAAWDRWRVADIRPYAELVLECFGADRVMFGSDWPVCDLAGGYAAVRSLADNLLDGCTATEQAAVLGGTARRVYGLP